MPQNHIDDQYDYARQVKERHEATLMEIPGVVSVGLGLRKVADAITETVCIVVGVNGLRNFRRSKRREKVPMTLEGVPVQLEEGGGIESQ